MYGLYSNGYYGMSWFGGSVMMIIFWVVLIWLVVWIVREAKGTNVHHGSQAMNILKERYARGEISKEEFESKKKDLA